MSGFVAIGRILFAILFVFSGAAKLFDVTATADKIAAKVVIPAALATYTTDLATAAGMPISQLLAIASGALEIICGVLIAVNLGAPFFALVLVLFVAAATYYFHDFWNMAGVEREMNTAQALKNLSLIGGLFIIAGLGRRRRLAETAYVET